MDFNQTNPPRAAGAPGRIAGQSGRTANVGFARASLPEYSVDSIFAMSMNSHGSSTGHTEYTVPEATGPADTQDFPSLMEPGYLDDSFFPTSQEDIPGSAFDPMFDYGGSLQKYDHFRNAFDASPYEQTWSREDLAAPNTFVPTLANNDNENSTGIADPNAQSTAHPIPDHSVDHSVLPTTEWPLDTSEVNAPQSRLWTTPYGSAGSQAAPPSAEPRVNTAINNYHQPPHVHQNIQNNHPTSTPDTVGSGRDRSNTFDSSAGQSTSTAVTTPQAPNGEQQQPEATGRPARYDAKISTALQQTSENADTETVFSSLEEARSVLRSGAAPKDLDPTIPTTISQKKAIIKVMLEVIESIENSRDNEAFKKAFNNKKRSKAVVERTCWEVLEATIERATNGGYESLPQYEGNFAGRMSEILMSLDYYKTICTQCFRGQNIEKLADNPESRRNETSGNKNLNNGRKSTYTLGKAVEKQKKAQNAAAMDQNTVQPAYKKGKANSKGAKQPTKRQLQSSGAGQNETSNAAETGPGVALNPQENTLQQFYQNQTPHQLGNRQPSVGHSSAHAQQNPTTLGYCTDNSSSQVQNALQKQQTPLYPGPPPSRLPGQASHNQLNDWDQPNIGTSNSLQNSIGANHRANATNQISIRDYGHPQNGYVPAQGGTPQPMAKRLSFQYIQPAMNQTRNQYSSTQPQSQAGAVFNPQQPGNTNFSAIDLPEHDYWNYQPTASTYQTPLHGLPSPLPGNTNSFATNMPGTGHGNYQPTVPTYQTPPQALPTPQQAPISAGISRKRSRENDDWDQDSNNGPLHPATRTRYSA